MTCRLARDPARRCRPFLEWPALDRALWEAAHQPGDPIDPGGLYADAARPSTRKRQSGYGRWLQWLDQGGALDPRQAPAARITPARVAAYVAALSAWNSSQTVLNRLQELYEAARVMEADRDWSWIRRIAARIRARHVPARPKAPRIVATDELFDLGRHLMAEAGQAGSARQQALQYRDGLLIAFLAARPLRRRNLTALRIGQSLRRQGPDWWIDIPGSETKTGAPLRMPVPDAITQAIDHYLAVHRPVLASRHGRWWRAAEDALWLSAHGSPMTEIALYDRVVRITQAALGRPLSPHLFRDSAATSVAIDDPDHVHIATPLLGHRSLATTERHYNQARGRQAVLRWQDHVRALRRQSSSGNAAANPIPTALHDGDKP